MAEWNDKFDVLKEKLKDELSVTGIPSYEERANNLLWSLIYSWEKEETCLVWVTSKPDSGVFGTDVIFVNDLVLSELGWTFEEWVDGTAQSNIFHTGENPRIDKHMQCLSSLQLLTFIKHKGDAPLAGDPYYLNVFHYAPYELRVIIGNPK